jgi:DNA-binding MarR family transcriptional regulator
MINRRSREMTTAQTLNPQILGQAEKAHGALLDRILAGTPHTYHHWVGLNLIVAGDGRIDSDAFVERITGALKIDDATARTVIDELSDAQLIEATAPGTRGLQLTGEGQETYRRIRAAVDQTIGRLYADIPADDLATAGRILAVVTARANAELARGS